MPHVVQWKHVDDLNKKLEAATNRAIEAEARAAAAEARAKVADAGGALARSVA